MLLQVNGISKSYGVSAVLSNISLQIEARERIGLVGVNGAGKSTLLQIIAGEISYDSGNIFKAKETKIGYLKQNSGLQSEETIFNEMLKVFAHLLDAEQELRKLEADMADPDLQQNEKKYEATLQRYAVLSDQFREKGGYEIEAKIRGVLHGMGFGGMSPETRVHTLSGGQKTRLALAKMLLEEPDLLMLDEPTNHLDIATLTWLEGYLRGYPGSILVVSHDRYFLDSLVEAIYEIERHVSRRYTGNYTRYVETKEAEYEIQLKQYEKQQEEIAKMEDFVQRNIVRASTTKRAQSRRKALDKMDRLDKPLGDLKRAYFAFEVEQATGKEVLQVSDLAIGFKPGEPLLRNISFQLRRGDTAALIGPNGIGKSTLLKTLIGQHTSEKGMFQWGTNVKIGFYDQEQAGLNPSNTILAEVWNAFPHIEEARIRTVLGNFLFSGEDVLKKISSLSGGEKARVSLAKLMLEKANVLILDEPTNHLDLYSKEVLESALIDYEGTLLFISHDRYFLNKMAEQMLELSSDNLAAYLGNYDDFVEKKQELAEMERQRLEQQALKKSGTAGGGSGAAANKSGGGGSDSSAGRAAETANGKPSDYADGKLQKREERSRQRKVEQLEADIARLEDEVAAIEAELANPDVYNNYVLVQEKNAQLDGKKAELTECYEQWEQLLG
ncbi:ABC-F family ATP-binding cassette domain-containing protein [Paenibacillus thalictri]|uniref:ABC-F type ribosomal protection protein n=1 Tax=Paenibacillus thalictri TaxID=2527873 RepID=A0A4Q9DDS8_9BACL|nr:ABC-F type ribosomal protection protein [Paenibacillus thalictri]TBL67753.1 ABC-F type ribosomal protection protein [Paenibacillus thalictri]